MHAHASGSLDIPFHIIKKDSLLRFHPGPF
jgi:hypothetical protein